MISIESHYSLITLGGDMTTNEDPIRRLEILEALIENTTDAIFIKDRGGRYSMINRAAARLVDKAKHEVIGRTAVELFSAEKAGRIRERDRNVMESKSNQQVEDVEVVDGKNRTYQSVRAPILDDRGEIEGIFCISRDITDQSEAKASLERISAQLEVRIRERTAELESEKEQFRAIAEGVDDFIALLDAQGCFLYVNHAYNKALFGEENTIIGISCFTHVHPKDKVLVRNVFSAIVTTGNSQSVIYRFVPVSGGERFVESVASPIRDVSENVSRIVVVSRDITKRIREEQERAKERERLELLVNELEQRQRESSALAKMTEDLQICDSIDKAYRVVKKYADKLFPTEFGTMNIFNSEENRIEEALSWGTQPKHRETLFTKDDCLALVRGGPHLVENPCDDLVCHHTANCERPYLCLPLIAQGEPIGVLHLQFALADSSSAPGRKVYDGWLQSQQKKALPVSEHLALAIANLKLKDKLKKEAIHDELTGLFNKRYMQQTLDLEVKKYARNARMLGLLMLDVDHFKRFNDDYGHEAGNVVLSGVGKLIKDTFRGSDIACRYGGEEFLIVLTEATQEAVMHRANELRENVKRLSLRYDGTNLPAVNFSIGVAFLPDHGKDVKQLLDAADKALYRAKALGRDRVVIAS